MGVVVFGRVAAIRDDEITLWHEDACRTYPAACRNTPHCAAGDLARLVLDDQGRWLALTVLTQAADSKADAKREDVLRWRKPDANGHSRMYYLQLRHRFLRRLQAWFDARGYTELALPVLVPAVNPEAHLALTWAETGWLSPSPELQMKRMLSGGFERIVSIGPVFRAREVSPRHNPEFTMVEWYHAWTSLDHVLDELEDLTYTLWTHSPLHSGDGFLRLADGKRIRMDARPWPRVPILKVIRGALGIDIFGVACPDELYARGARHGLFAPEHKGERYEELFTRLWERCEQALNFDTPVFITEWPSPLASLARRDPENPGVAKRAELMIAGIELANGFEELTDAEEQRARFERDMETRRQMQSAKRMRGAADAESKARRALPKMDEKFLEALDAGLPPCAGMALGFERLSMLLAGAAEIRSLLPFGSDEL